MAIHGVSNAATPIPQQNSNAQRVQPKRDNDGDNDGSHTGEVEQQEPNHKLSSTSTIGSIINTTA
ncbi:MAG: hypothetical protein HY272_06550 [Gammaproteobacteria bacterium]|nr:hypothetical protein [Gammaproteobacteria bacterium]